MHGVVHLYEPYMVHSCVKNWRMRIVVFFQLCCNYYLVLHSLNILLFNYLEMQYRPYVAYLWSTVREYRVNGFDG
jgi:hypothetical protein